VHLSCASVYDGSDGNYSEDNLDFALHDELGKQKLAAESYIRAQTMESTILRVGPVLGLGHPYRPSAFDKFRLALGARKKVEASKLTVNSYLSTQSFAEAVSLVLKSESAGRHRLFNLGGPALSEFDLFQGWARLLGQEANVIPPVEETTRNCSVKSDALKKTFPEWRQESREELYLNLLKELTPGIGVKKWQKTLRIP
jgi:dTDP-4-dehydrorhamnose reductase